MTKCKQELFCEGSQMFNMLGDFYRLNKALMNGDKNGIRSDAYWDEVIAKCNAFCDKYNRTRYALALSLTLLTELENRDKEESEVFKSVS